MNTELNNKKLYKILLIFLKILPMIMAVSYIMNVLFADLVIGGFAVFHYLGLVIAPIAFMYIASYVFKFCNYHRCFLHFIAIEELLTLTDYYIGIPLDNEMICEIHYMNMTFFAVLFVVLYIKKRKEEKSKKDESI